ncbi:MAG: chitobiase/beta-hexosaminidase C-terminal domain-containing protein [Candidatus Cloacimonetes bacterium]|jgi:N-acetyl-beta-hexosaminidase|nr:chitobiase/beta-hexosaminidase C-terminal domain-containing protein [Candidatus Cloacimonadota bacterium]
MKKLIYFLILIMLFLTSCYKYDNPFDAQYQDDNKIVRTPAFSLVGGEYTSYQVVTITCTTDDASIYYTTNGTDPTESSTRYSSAISIKSTTTLKAKAFKAGYKPSSTLSAAYTLDLPIAASPTFSVAAGTYTTVQIVSISCATGGASIHYTTNGIDPTESSALYTAPISISFTTTLKAKAFIANYNSSSIATATYTLNFPTVATPTLSPAAGTYTTVQTVSISCATNGTSIRYTTNGADPTESSSAYSSPISVLSTTTLKVKAFKANYNPSSTVTAIYTINLPTIATPTFSPAAGTYTTVQTVSISCATSGASIRYTTNGTDPTESSSQYSSPISVQSTTTLKVKAFKANYNPSSIVTATYTINLPTVATPSISLASGTYTGGQTTSISCSTSGASIRYTTNGADPTESSTLYTSPVSIPITTTLKARAFKLNYNPSATASASYTIIPAPIWVDHFNDLSAWSNTSSSSEAWYISSGTAYIDAHEGTFAMSQCSGNGYGDKLSRTFNFTTGVTLKIWLSRYASGSITVYVKVDGVTLIEYATSSAYPSSWVQRQCNIPSGTHTVSIETNYNGSAGIDELEIYANN